MPHYLGHRERLRQRFLDSPETLPDYELLELALCLSQPRGDMKPLAKELMNRFGSIGAVFAAPTEKLLKVKGMGSTSVSTLRLMIEMTRRGILEDIKAAPYALNTVEKVLDHLRLTMAHQDIEQFRILFFNRKYHLIADEVQQKGTLDQLPIYPREVLRRSLELNAGSLILAHNHPSGDATPSQADIQMTRHLKEVLQAAEIHILDHIVIGAHGYTSLRQMGHC